MDTSVDKYLGLPLPPVDGDHLQLPPLDGSADAGCGDELVPGHELVDPAVDGRRVHVVRVRQQPPLLNTLYLMDIRVIIYDYKNPQNFDKKSAILF